jgi:bromodomain adjacent to zinc finger domain protein 1A
MPTCRRKRVVLTEPSETLLQLAKTDPNKEVYYMQQTGEIFETYEYDIVCLSIVSSLELTGRVSCRAYAARMSFYRLRQFQCEVTGKSGLDYFQAIESELLEARTMHSRFPEQLKSAVLKAVQWRECPSSFCTMYASMFMIFRCFVAEVMGRLDHLVEAVYERFKDRYFEEESAYPGCHYWACFAA